MKTKTYDYVIIGGGIAGLSCAYWINKLKPKARVVIIDSGEIENTTQLEKQLSNLMVGCIGHLYRIYQKHGIEEVIATSKLYDENLSLIDEELEDVTDNYYVKLFKGGTINAVRDADMKELGFFKSFAYQLEKYDFPIRKIENKQWEIGVQFEHEGTYDAHKFTKSILGRIKGRTRLIEKSKCQMINRSLDSLAVRLFNGEEILGKKVILANSNSLPSLLPEIKDEIKSQQSYVFKFDPAQEDYEFNQYVNQRDDDLFVKNDSGFYFAKRANILKGENEVNEYEATDSFEKFVKEGFSGGTVAESARFSIAYTENGFPITGRSKKNPSLYYLGAFSGQSKLYAFKMAKDLVEDTLQQSQQIKETA